MTQDQKRQTENNTFKSIYVKHCIKYKWFKHLKSRSCLTEFKKHDPNIYNLQKNPLHILRQKGYKQKHVKLYHNANINLLGEKNKTGYINTTQM